MSMFFFFDEDKQKEPIRSANKGEWSEVYVMFKLLGEGRLYVGDEHYNKVYRSPPT